ncbi:MAG TPA: ABC transporter permease [Thermoleophilia bacterium]|nr:ABC transporter permease [Thermoleophilia bacterium]
MGDLLTAAFVSALLSGGVMAGMPLLLASLGEAISERAGVLNIGLEGMMLAGAYAGFVAVLLTGSHWLGLGAGLAAGMAVSVLMVGLCVRLGLSQIVVGIAILLTAEGVTSVLHRAQFGTTYPRLGSMAVLQLPVLSGIPVVGASLFSQPAPVYAGLGLVVAAWWVLRSTNFGLELRAAGEKPEALDAAGVSVVRTRSLAVLCAGALAGLGGAYMSIIGAGIFVPFMTHGAGFIAIVLAMLARGRAAWVVIGSFAFGMTVSLATALQLVGVFVPIDLVNMLPFVVVLVALVIFARRAYLPSALGLPYQRGSR